MVGETRTHRRRFVPSLPTYCIPPHPSGRRPGSVTVVSRRREVETPSPRNPQAFDPCPSESRDDRVPATSNRPGCRALAQSPTFPGRTLESAGPDGDGGRRGKSGLPSSVIGRVPVVGRSPTGSRTGREGGLGRGWPEGDISESRGPGNP